MVDKANGSAAGGGRGPAADRPEHIRNVVLVGHSGSGKTTLVEAMALTARAVNRAGRVEDGTSLSDYDEIEHRQHRSVQLSVVPVAWAGMKINLLDTPGYADFVGELRAGCARPTRRCSLSPRPRVQKASRVRPERCGKSAQRSACRVPS